MAALEATAEELALKEQVAKALESQGVLGKIKAQLRTAVFQAIHRPAGKDGAALLSTRPSVSTALPVNAVSRFGSDGELALELVRNLLQCLELEHTLSVFQAEANIEGKATAWTQPKALCEHVNVTAADEHTPVLIKLLRHRSRQHADVPAPNAKASFQHHEPVKSEALRLEAYTAQATHSLAVPTLPLVPSLPPVPVPAVKTESTIHRKVEDDEQDDALEASVTDEIASGTFEEESLAEEASASMNRSDDDDKRHIPTVKPIDTENRKPDTTAYDDSPPVAASPPPVPTKLGSLPSLPGMASFGGKKQQAAEKVDEEDERDKSPTKKDDDDFDEEEEAARLRALDAKLKAMEAEDDTGVLQQLKATLQVELAEDEASGATGKGRGGDDDEEADDNYGSDFEEEAEEEDIQSELSEDLASMSALSESEDASLRPSHAKSAAAPVALANDKAVDSEDALNSYDYIEHVERD